MVTLKRVAKQFILWAMLVGLVVTACVEQPVDPIPPTEAPTAEATGDPFEGMSAYPNITAEAADGACKTPLSRAQDNQQQLASLGINPIAQSVVEFSKTGIVPGQALLFGNPDAITAILNELGGEPKEGVGFGVGRGTVFGQVQTNEYGIDDSAEFSAKFNDLSAEIFGSNAQIIIEGGEKETRAALSEAFPDGFEIADVEQGENDLVRVRIQFSSTGLTLPALTQQFQQAAAQIAVSNPNAQPVIRMDLTTQQIPIAEPNRVLRGIVSGDMGSSGIGASSGTEDLGADALFNEFDSQPAFKLINRPPQAGGKGVHIIAFDTTPLPTGQHRVELAPQANYPLCVNAFLSDAAGTPVVANPENSHGLFAINLSHGVANAASLQLVQVLEYDNHDAVVGSIDTLANAMFTHLNGVKEPTVVNLSLGFETDKITSLTLQGVMQGYERQGVVFVAASGNDALNAIQQPAAYPFIVGVASSTLASDRACYSNWGNVAAFGGDGIRSRGAGPLNCVMELKQTCKQALDEKTTCEFGVMSISMPKAGETIFSYWLGTSFAAPQVSGVAARVVEASGSARPDAVRAAIYCGASPVPSGGNPLGAGVVDASQAASSACAP